MELALGSRLQVDERPRLARPTKRGVARTCRRLVVRRKISGCDNIRDMRPDCYRDGNRGNPHARDSLRSRP